MTKKQRNYAVDWTQARKDYEKGDSVGILAKRYNLAISTINNRASKDQWTRFPKVDTKVVLNRATEIAAQGVANAIVKGNKLSRLEEFVSRSIDQNAELLGDVGDARSALKDKGALNDPSILRELITAHSQIVKTGREIHGLDRTGNQINIQFNGMQGMMQSAPEEVIDVESETRQD